MRGKRKNNKIRKTKSMNAKQNKLLATRLIAISMRIDEHVYSHKDISPKEAMTYINEMAACKVLCRGDARHLQVIEKITRCMQAIIKENQPAFGNNVTANTLTAFPTPNTCPSPTYSLPDEDKELLSQASGNTNGDIANTVEDRTEMDTIDLCSDDEEISTVKEVQVDVEIHKAMSNLSITNEAPLVTQGDCSQSILNNFNPDATQIFKEHDYSEIRKQSTTAQTTEYTIGKVLKNINTGAATVKGPKEITSIAHTSQQKLQKNLRFQNNNVTIQEVVEERKKREEKVKNKKQRKRRNKDNNKKDSKITSKNMQTDKQTKVTRKKKTMKDLDTNDSVSGKHLNKETDTTNNLEKNVLLHGMNNQINVVNNNHQKAQTSNNYYKNNVPNQAMNYNIPKIYTPAVQNDLSWMENIRYVREINTDEYDPKLSCVEDAFWNNCSFPKEWNNEEFDYFL